MGTSESRESSTLYGLFFVVSQDHIAKAGDGEFFGGDVDVKAEFFSGVGGDGADAGYGDAVDELFEFVGR